MTLRCECGGRVRVQDGTDPEDSAGGFFELYECQACGRTGTLRADTTTNETHLSGCLVSVNTRAPVEVNRGP